MSTRTIAPIYLGDSVYADVGPAADLVLIHNDGLGGITIHLDDDVIRSLLDYLMAIRAWRQLVLDAAEKSQ